MQGTIRLAWIAFMSLGWPAGLFAQCVYDRLDCDRGHSYMGSVMAFSGDHLLAGAPVFDTEYPLDDNGGVFAYRRSGDSWIEVQRIQPSDTAPDDRFGSAIAIDGDIAVMGKQTSEDYLGAAYVFHWNGSQWEEVERLLPETRSVEVFGSAIALSGDWLAIGAPRFEGPEFGQGRVVLFKKDATSGRWIEDSVLLASDPNYLAAFGSELIFEGDQLLVGTPWAGTRQLWYGAVYVFRESGGVWTEEQKLESPAPCHYAQFGSSMAVQGGTLVVGAPEDGRTAEGLAYTFVDATGSWEYEATFDSPIGWGGDRYAHSVAIDGDVIVIGAPERYIGRVYAYERDGGWHQRWSFAPKDGEPPDRFGMAVAVIGNRVYASSPNKLVEAVSSGVIYQFIFGQIAAATHYGTGWPGAFGTPELTADEPILGEELSLTITNTAGTPTVSFLLKGFTEASLDTNLGGTLLVLPDSLIVLPTGPGGVGVSTDIPCDPALDGISLYLQVLQQDAGASHGVSFSEGLRLDIGTH